MRLDLRRFGSWVRGALGVQPSIGGRARGLLAAGLFSISFAVRCLYSVDLAPLMYSQAQPGTRMAARYHDVAMSILDGQGILFPARPDAEDTGRLARPPGYGAFLAAVYGTLGRSFFAVQLVQNLLDSLSPVLIFLVASLRLSWRVGAVSGLISAFVPQLTYASNLISADALCAVPLLAAVLALAVDADPGLGPLWRPPLAGALIGLGVWLRPNVLLLGPFMAGLLLVISTRRRRALWSGGLLALVSLAVIAPITIRNYLVYRAFVPVSINGGITLWQGIAAAGGQRFGAQSRDRLVIEEEAFAHGNPRYAEWWAHPDGIRRDRERYRRALAVIRQHPGWYAKAMLGRMVEMLDYGFGPPLVAGLGQPAPPPPPGPVGEEAPEALSEGQKPAWPRVRPRISDEACLAPGKALSWARPAVRALQAATVLTLRPFLLAGAIVVCLLSWRTALFILAVPLYYFLFESMFILEWRVFAPMHYALVPLAAAAWVLLFAGIRAVLRRGAG